MHTLSFPESFSFGTSTSACQIETAFEHDWQGVVSRDGHVFDRTTDHELRTEEDADIIASLAPNYRMSLMWSRLQRAPLAPLDAATVAHYHRLLSALRNRGVSIMMVLHHFVNPLWFVRQNGWQHSRNVDLWVDYAQKVIREFGQYVNSWNTFNEPNLYATLGYAAGEFPPFRKNLLTARRVIRNMAGAHDRVFDHIKELYPSHAVGISHNCAVFDGENIMGRTVASLADRWYMDFIPNQFKKSDFTGISYYARISFDPRPVTQVYTPKKIKRFGKAHDDIWEYYPEGMLQCMERYWQLSGKPLIITENGVCTSDEVFRVKAIRDYMKVLHSALAKKIDVRGYYHWTAWDNFEWTLGPTYRFGLYSCDPVTMERKKKPAADVYARLAYSKKVDV